MDAFLARIDLLGREAGSKMQMEGALPGGPASSFCLRMARYPVSRYRRYVPAFAGMLGSPRLRGDCVEFLGRAAAQFDEMSWRRRMWI